MSRKKETQQQALSAAPTVDRAVKPGSPDETPIERYERLRSELRDTARQLKAVIDYQGLDDWGSELLAQLIADLEQDKFTVAVFGVTAAGKSTLLNGLLGERILRPGLGETTRTLTKICAPTRDNPASTVEIVFKTLKELNMEVTAKLKSMLHVPSGEDLEKEQVADISDPAFRSWLRSLVRDGSSDPLLQALARYLNYLLEGWEGCRNKLGKVETMDLESSEEVLQKESFACYVKERILYHDNALTRHDFVIYDSPGLGSTFARHTDEAAELASKMDCALVVTKVDYKFMEPDRRFLQDTLDLQRTKDRKNLVFVLNQISRINPLDFTPPRPADRFDECVDEEVDKLRARLAELDLQEAKIFPTDAACYLYSVLVEKHPGDPNYTDSLSMYAMVDKKSDVPDPTANKKASRVPEFHEGLIHHLKDIRYHTFLGRRLDRLQAASNRHRRQLQDVLLDRKSTLTELEKKLEMHMKNRAKVERRLNDLKHVLKGRLDEHMGGFDSLRLQIAAGVKDIIVRASQDYISKNLTIEKTLKDNLRSIVGLIINRAKPEVKNYLQSMRKEYEREWTRLKEEVTDKEIPEIISEYGSDIPWGLEVKNLDQAMVRTIRGMEALNFSMWQRFVATVKIYLNKVFKKGYSERELAEVFTNYLIDNYWTNYADDLVNDVTSWVIEDLEYYHRQILDYWQGLADSIRTRILKEIENKKKAEVEVTQSEEMLEHFIRQTDNATARLKELAKEVERARPR